MAYAAPVKDIRFALDEVAGVLGLKADGRFPDLSDDVLRAVLDHAGALAAETLAPLNQVGDTVGSHLENGVVVTPPGFKEAYAAFVDGGWQGLAAPVEQGGAGLPNAMLLAVMEMIQSANMAFGLAPMLTAGAVEAMSRHGSPDQKRLYLPKLVTGAWSGTMNLTEPQAGSDVGALQTKAAPAGDGSYKIAGQKIYITWGDHDMAENIVHLVLARLPDAPEGAKGVSLFVVPKYIPNADGTPGRRNDIRIIGLEEKLGIHASPTCVIAFGENEGATGWLVGEPNRGMNAMFVMMNSARLHVGLQGVAIAERAYQRALAYAKERRQGRAEGIAEYPARIVDHADVRRHLLTMKAWIEAGRGMCYMAAVAGDEAISLGEAEDRAAALRRQEFLVPIAKAWCTDRGVDAASLALQLHGGMGFIEETGAAQHYRDARIAPIYEGTNGIQAIDLVGRKLMQEDGLALDELTADIRQTVEDCQASSHPELHRLGRRLAAAAEAMEEAADYLIETIEIDRRRALAGATPFLKLAGDVVGGWVLAIGAVAAIRRLKEGDPDQSYLQAKVSLARFYAETVLAVAPAALSDVQIGDELIFAASEDALLGA